MPRSGSRTINATGSPMSAATVNRSLKVGGSGRSWKYQAIISGRAIFINSEGWKRPMPGSSSQRWEPFTVTPASSTATSSSTPTAYRPGAKRRYRAGCTCAAIAINTSAKHTRAICPPTMSVSRSTALYSMMRPYRMTMISNTQRMGSRCSRRSPARTTRPLCRGRLRTNCGSLIGLPVPDPKRRARAGPRRGRHQAPCGPPARPRSCRRRRFRPAR